MGSLSEENSANFLKIKTEVLNHSTAMKEADLVFSNDYSEVCKFMCLVCNKTVDRLKTHMMTIHGQKVSEVKITKKNYHQETYHKCGICEKVILFTKGRIRNHVDQIHNMSLKEYNDKFMKPEIKKNKIVKVLTKNVKKEKTRSRSSNYLSLILLKIDAYDENVDESLLSDSYRDVCKVQCSLCQKTVDLDLFSVHLKKHYLSFAEYKSKNGIPVVTNRTFHKCGICGLVLLFTRVRISGHVTQKHSMSIKEYAKQYLTKINRGPANYEVNDAEVDRDVMYSNDYEDECKAVCKVCHKECSFANLNSHVYQVHNTRATDYLTQFGPVELSRKAYHECAICHKTLLFVRYHIATHVKTKHKISLNDYNREHMQFHNVEYSETSFGERGRQVGHQKAPKWCDGTNYRCPYCHNIYYRYFTFRIHLIRSHEVKDAGERSKVVRMNEMTTDTYNCKICGQGVKKDRMDIEAHIKQVHKTTYRVYEENFESGKVGDDDGAVVERLIGEGVIAMPDKLPKKRGRNKRKGEEVVSPWMNGEGGTNDNAPKKRKRRKKDQFKPVPWMNVANIDISQKTEDNSNEINEAVNIIRNIGESAREDGTKEPHENNDTDQLPAKRIRRVPAKLSSAEFVGVKTIPPSTPNKRPPFPKVQKHSPLKSKSLTKIKSKISPLKAISPKPKLNKTNNNSIKKQSSIDKVLLKVKQEPVIKQEPVEKKAAMEIAPVTEVKKEVEEVLMYKCPLPGCDWICTREGMRKGPAVLHLLRIHKIQPIEMRQRGIKFVTL